MFIEQKVAFDVPGERRVHFKVSLLTCSRRGRRLPPGGNTNMVLNGGGKARVWAHVGLPIRRDAGA